MNKDGGTIVIMGMGAGFDCQSLVEAFRKTTAVPPLPTEPGRKKGKPRAFPLPPKKL